MSARKPRITLATPVTQRDVHVGPLPPKSESSLGPYGLKDERPVLVRQPIPHVGTPSSASDSRVAQTIPKPEKTTSTKKTLREDTDEREGVKKPRTGEAGLTRAATTPIGKGEKAKQRKGEVIEIE
jgi:hypothetical protein